MTAAAPDPSKAAGMAAELSYRDATGADVGALVVLIESAYRGDSSREGWTTEADLLGGQRTDPDAVAGVIDAPGSRIRIVEGPDDDLVACCQLEQRADGVAYFGMFAVRPGTQGRGIGRQVLVDVERLARTEMGATVLQMTVIRQRTDLIAWYRRLGFEDTGARIPFPYGDERYGLPQREDLEFVVLAKQLTGEAG